MFTFWPFNIARKRREAEQPKPEPTCIEECEDAYAGVILRAKRNKVIPVDDPRHPRNLTPQQRAAAFRKELAAPYGVQQQQQPESVVREFRCDHPAISEFWQEQQARCDSPADTSSPSCDAPSSTD